MKLAATLTKGLTEEEVKTLAREIKDSILARALRKFCREQIELSYKVEEASTMDQDYLPLYLKEVGERRGYRQVLHLILEE
jgi:hypothetical protein